MTLLTTPVFPGHGAIGACARARRSPSTPAGFTLIEVLIALAIAMIIMGALAGLFAQSVKTRTQVQQDGQKIENARYSLDVLAEDIRLAGYWGTYSPPTSGSSPADWKYAAPCSTTGGSPLPGWNPGASPVQVPFAIFGYEAHNADGTAATLPTALTDCLPNYKSGTDVIVVRRAGTSTLTTASSTYVAGDPYLQVSSCGIGSIDSTATPFLALATATATDFNLHTLACTTTAPGANASLRRLYTRIYYVASCNANCTGSGDGIPTLKMVELAVNGGSLKVAENVKAIAPGVENLHFEYGVDGQGSPWVTNTAVTAGAVRYSGNYYYTTAAGGTTGATAPSHTSGNASDGGVTWAYSGRIDGATDSYLVSNADPFNGASGTLVSGMRVDSAGENRWEDVVAVKVWVVVRDLNSTDGYTDSRSYVLGSRSQAAASDAYKRKVSASTIKVVNMSARREQP